MREAPDRIFLRGVHVFARHGVLEEEKRLGQRFEIDVECGLDVSDYARRDAYEDALCYQSVHDIVRETAEGERFDLVEALAEAIAERLFARFEMLAEARVEIRKPSAPITGVFGTVGVAITRKRPA